MSIAVPQVEYIGGNTPQEAAALFNAKMVELRFNKPTFERDGAGFWIIYNKEIEEAPIPTAPVMKKWAGRPTCGDCPAFEAVSDRVKWGKCRLKGYASVNKTSTACSACPTEGGDELNA